MHVIYPSNPLRPKQPDEQFAAEADEVRAVGFQTSVFSMEDFQNGEFRLVPALPPEVEVLYRGWMMSALEYNSFTSSLAHIAKAHPITSLESYLSSHHLPNLYPLISDLTPETRIFPPACDLESELRGLSWPEFFIKDYVKSLKTAVGSRISKPEQVSAVVTDMRRFRGTIEGGFCVRRVEDFVAETELRYFVMDRVPHAPGGQVPSIVLECAKRLQSRFYSVDVAQRTDGQLRSVEVGDGQVSDLVGWMPAKFAAVLREHFLPQP
jgi:hypothetical protein